MRFPDIFAFNDHRPYFAAFFELNQSEQKFFSYRYFANKINWPHSLIPELIDGSKRLTIARAVEFGSFAGFDSFAMERLTLFALRDDPKIEVRSYFDEKLQREQNTVLPQETITLGTSTLKKDDFEALPFAIFEILIWANGEITMEEIRRLLLTFGDVPLTDIQSAIQYLSEKNIIQVTGRDQYSIPRKMIFMHNRSGKSDALAQHRALAENFIRFLPKTVQPFTYNSGFVQLPNIEPERLFEKFHMLRNWLEQLNQETLDRKDLKMSDKLIFQYDLNLFPIIDPSVARRCRAT